MARITPRKRQVLEFVAAGRTNGDIARAIGLSPSAVDKHVRALLARYDAPSRAALVFTALRRGDIR